MYVQNIFEKYFVRSMFSCVRSSYDLCARAHAHSLEGTLTTTNNTKSNYIDWDLSVIKRRQSMIWLNDLEAFRN